MTNSAQDEFKKLQEFVYTQKLELLSYLKYCIWGTLILALCGLGGLFYMAATEEDRPSELYTVQTADAVYRDLTKGRNYGTWANYTTVDGKTITFNGTFTEIEQ